WARIPRFVFAARYSARRGRQNKLLSPNRTGRTSQDTASPARCVCLRRRSPVPTRASGVHLCEKESKIEAQWRPAQMPRVGLAEGSPARCAWRTPNFAASCLARPHRFIIDHLNDAKDDRQIVQVIPPTVQEGIAIGQSQKLPRFTCCDTSEYRNLRLAFDFV